MNDEAVPKCRICYEVGTEQNSLEQACRCDGSVAFTHGICLNTWIATRPPNERRICELCHTAYLHTYIRASSSVYPTMSSMASYCPPDTQSAETALASRIGYCGIGMLIATVLLLIGYYHHLRNHPIDTVNVHVLTIFTGLTIIGWTAIVFAYYLRRRAAKQRRMQEEPEWALRRVDESRHIRWTLSNV